MKRWHSAKGDRMDPSEEIFASLTKSIEENEKKTLRRVWISSMVPLCFGILLLGYTIWQIQVYGEKLAEIQEQLDITTQKLHDASSSLQETEAQLEYTKAELEKTQKTFETTASDLEKLRKELDEANTALQEVQAFANNSYEIDIVDEKSSLASEYPYESLVLFEIQRLQFSGIEWNLYGFSEAEGFNSPGFAIYIMQKQNMISGNYGPDARPWEILPLVDQPSVGDIIYYKGGYSMFYFEQNGEGFVIGMTPLGIISLKPDFAPILGYLDVPY